MASLNVGNYQQTRIKCLDLIRETRKHLARYSLSRDTVKSVSVPLQTGRCRSLTAHTKQHTLEPLLRACNCIHTDSAYDINVAPRINRFRALELRDLVKKGIIRECQVGRNWYAIWPENVRLAWLSAGWNGSLDTVVPVFEDDEDVTSVSTSSGVPVESQDRNIERDSPSSSRPSLDLSSSTSNSRIVSPGLGSSCWAPRPATTAPRSPVSPCFSDRSPPQTPSSATSRSQPSLKTKSLAPSWDEGAPPTTSAKSYEPTIEGLSIGFSSLCTGESSGLSWHGIDESIEGSGESESDGETVMQNVVGCGQTASDASSRSAAPLPRPPSPSTPTPRRSRCRRQDQISLAPRPAGSYEPTLSIKSSFQTPGMPAPSQKTKSTKSWEPSLDDYIPPRSTGSYEPTLSVNSSVDAPGMSAASQKTQTTKSWEPSLNSYVAPIRPPITESPRARKKKTAVNPHREAVDTKPVPNHNTQDLSSTALRQVAQLSKNKTVQKWCQRIETVDTQLSSENLKAHQREAALNAVEDNRKKRSKRFKRAYGAATVGLEDVERAMLSPAALAGAMGEEERAFLCGLLRELSARIRQA